MCVVKLKYKSKCEDAIATIKAFIRMQKYEHPPSSTRAHMTFGME